MFFLRMKQIFIALFMLCLFQDYAFSARSYSSKRSNSRTLRFYKGTISQLRKQTKKINRLEKKIRNLTRNITNLKGFIAFACFLMVISLWMSFKLYSVFRSLDLSQYQERDFARSSGSGQQENRAYQDNLQRDFAHAPEFGGDAYGQSSRSSKKSKRRKSPPQFDDYEESEYFFSEHS